jgi:acetylglutamate/LysW-gamma-L-alpha-aminoadipate kinase
MTTIHVLKLGGGAGVEHAAALRNLASRILDGEPWVLVHGCSAAADDLALQVGYTVQTITSPGGYTSRYTDARMIEIYSAAAASVNQQLTAQLVGHGVRAVGLAGPGVIYARRKEAIRAIRDGRPVIIRDDYSGTITGTATGLLHTLLDAGLTPVVAPLAIGEQFERLNVDGDLAAAAIARELGANTLIILSNVPGLLRDVDDPASVVPQFGLHEMARHEPLAQGRMKKKLIAAQQAEIERVILADARVDYPLDDALNGAGTHIVREVVYAGHGD